MHEMIIRALNCDVARGKKECIPGQLDIFKRLISLWPWKDWLLRSTLMELISDWRACFSSFIPLEVKDSSLCGLTNHQVGIAASENTELNSHYVRVACFFPRVLPPGAGVSVAMLLSAKQLKVFTMKFWGAVGIWILHWRPFGTFRLGISRCVL